MMDSVITILPHTLSGDNTLVCIQFYAYGFSTLCHCFLWCYIEINECQKLPKLKFQAFKWPKIGDFTVSRTLSGTNGPVGKQIFSFQ